MTFYKYSMRKSPMLRCKQTYMWLCRTALHVVLIPFSLMYGDTLTFPLCLPPWTTIHTQTPNKLVNPIPGVSRASYPVSNPHTIWTHSPWHTTTPHYNTIHSWRESWAGTTLHHWYAPTWPLYCIWLCIEENVLQLAIRQSRMGWEAVVWKGLARFTTIGCLHLNESRGLIPGDIRQ